MQLNLDALRDVRFFERAGIALPQYDVPAVQQRTRQHPVWAHFGTGNLFRAFLCNAQQKLLNQGLQTSGITAIVSDVSSTMEPLYRAHDNLTLLCQVAPGQTEKAVIGSIGEAVLMSDRARLRQIFEQPSLQLVSLTITEKGYAWPDEAELPDTAASTIGLLTACLLWRSRRDLPIALVSMDNCQNNGDLLRKNVLAVAQAWIAGEQADAGFLAYLEHRVSFPVSMIDKIVPGPLPKIEALLKGDGFTDLGAVTTSRNTVIAPFVNAEFAEYLVIEDAFPNGRPPLEQAGVLMTTRSLVQKAERMKVTCCLNPVHTALAIYGCLLGFTRIPDEMDDPLLRALAIRVGEEGMAVTEDPGILSMHGFFDELVHKRLRNTALGDAPQRIAADTSQKLPIRFGETVRRHMERGDADQLVGVPLVLAGWLRYLMASDDQGNPMPLSHDPLLPQLTQAVKGDLRDVLSSEKLFGADLKRAGLLPKVEQLVSEMQGVGAVRQTLERTLRA